MAVSGRIARRIATGQAPPWPTDKWCAAADRWQFPRRSAV